MFYDGRIFHKHIPQHRQRCFDHRLGLNAIGIEVGGFCRFALFRIADEVHHQRHQTCGLFPLKLSPCFGEYEQLPERQWIGIDSGDSGEFEDDFVNASSASSIF